MVGLPVAGLGDQVRRQLRPGTGAEIIPHHSAADPAGAVEVGSFSAPLPGHDRIHRLCYKAIVRISTSSIVPDPAA